ncbi:MAG: RNA polymerase sigma factor [Lachnospiraceae bacterium]|nr:RNA polymerase sigma factor [Lachnospiraceae bacterium]
MTIEEAVIKYSPMLYRICVVMLGNETDAQDAVQDTICKYLEHTKKFRDQEHEKAWLIRVARNRCIDMQRFRLRHPQIELSEITASYENPEYSEVLTQLVALPVPVKTAVYLYYIEGYKTKEVSDILGISVNAVKKRLQRGRKLLRLRLEEDYRDTEEWNGKGGKDV